MQGNNGYESTKSKKITESYNPSNIVWKRPLRSSSQTISPTPPCLLNHIPKCQVHTLFEHLQGWGLNHLPVQPIPMSDRSFSNEIFPNI